MLELVFRPWPWYVAGPLIGLFVPALLLLGNRVFGISSNLRHLCAAIVPGRVEFFRYDWKDAGSWNLMFLAGVLFGGFIGARLLSPAGVVLAPADVFSWHGLFTLRGAIAIVGGGFLVGFGTAYAGGCTSGHAISGLANFERASLVAVLGFFAGGLLCTYFVVPLLF
jgi:uncharacterized membrane protein YedE/YeeE